MPDELDNLRVKKATAIYAGMSAGVKTKIDDRLKAASPEEKSEIKSLLHYSWRSRPGTDDSRIDMRKAVAGYLAAGGTVEGAQCLKDVLPEMDAEALKALGKSMTTSSSPAYSLCRAFLSDNVDGADENIAKLGPIVGGFPTNLEKSGKPVYETGGRIVAHDKEGDLQILSRNDLIGQISAKYAELGCQVEALANLEASLQNTQIATLSGAAYKLAEPGSVPEAELGALLDRGSATAKVDFQNFKTLIDQLPSGPANQMISADLNMTLRRDETGKAQVINVDVAFTGVEIPQQNQGMSGEKIDKIKADFKTLAETNYGRAAVPLDFANYARKNSDTKTMKECFADYQPSGAEISKDFKNSDCLVLSERLVEDLTRAGITAYPAGVWTEGLTQQRVEGSKQSVADAGINTARVTHLDVVVPYTNEQGEDRALVLTPGMGTDDKYVKDLPLDALGDMSYGPARLRMGEDGRGVDSVDAQKSAMGYLTNIQITKVSEDKKQLAGIDLIGGKIYLNTEASRHQSVGMKLENGSVSFDFREAMKNPEDKVMLFEGQDQQVEVTKFEALTVFATGIKDQFELPDHFVDDLVYLAGNEQEYREAVMWSSVQQMHGLGMNGLEESLEQQESVPPVTNADMLMPAEAEASGIKVGHSAIANGLPNVDSDSLGEKEVGRKTSTSLP